MSNVKMGTGGLVVRKPPPEPLLEWEVMDCGDDGSIHHLGLGEAVWASLCYTGSTQRWTVVVRQGQDSLAYVTLTPGDIPLAVARDTAETLLKSVKANCL